MFIPVDLTDCANVVFDRGKLALIKNLDFYDRVHSASLWYFQLLSLFYEDLNSLL
jgi:hypothetical protein